MIFKLISYIKSELKGWKIHEIVWIMFSTFWVLGLSLYWKDSLIGIIAAVTGVWYTLLAGKGKRSCFIIGTVNVLFYSYTSFHAKYFGEVMLNMLYYLPMNFIGWFAWKNHIDSTTGEVIKQHLTFKKRIVVYLLTAVGVFLYAPLLAVLGGSLPLIDSTSTVLSVTAQLLTVWRLKEQWILWIIVNGVSVVMWAVNFAQGKENISMILMWGLYLINAFIMYFRWNKDIKANSALPPEHL